MATARPSMRWGLSRAGLGYEADVRRERGWPLTDAEFAAEQRGGVDPPVNISVGGRMRLRGDVWGQRSGRDLRCLFSHLI